MPTRKILAFVHIEKTAGTSMIHILRHNNFMRYLDVRPLYSRGDNIFTAQDLRLSLKINPFIRAIAGHSVVPYSDLESVADMEYITLLRNPVNRYISQYRYWGKVLGRNLTPEEFLDKTSENNMQVMKIAGEPNVQKAIDILESKFICYGIVEKFESFIQNLAQVEAGRGRHFEPISVERNLTGKSKISEQDLLDKYESRIIENNSKDIELYQYVKKHVEQNDSMSGDSIVKKIKRPTFKLYADYLMRKIYYMPVTGLIRISRGMKAKGSYSELL